MNARAAGVALLLLGASAVGDELSGADKLRMVWSTQFEWTRDGMPLVTVRLAEGRDEITVSGIAGGSPVAPRVLPDGEGGAEVQGGTTWTVRLEGKGRPVTVKWHVVVARGLPSEGERLQKAAAEWRARGFSPRTFELGTVFGIRGAVIDGRERLLTVSPKDREEEARAEARALAAKFSVETDVHPEVIERFGGVLVARDERGMQLRNEGVIWFAPVEGGRLLVEPVDKVGGAGERRAYAGQVYVTVDAKGSLAVVNAVPGEKLLDGLLPAEMGAGAPTEALKAQAVAARNELLAKIGTRHLTDPYRLCSTVHCQVYAGAEHEDPRTTAAVKATHGEVMVRADGRLVDAVYSSSCGGHTEDKERAWGPPADPALRGRFDASDEDAKALAKVDPGKDVRAFLGELPRRPWCAKVKGGSPFRWTARVPASTVEEKAGVGALKDLVVLERGVSGRAVKMKLVGERGEKVIEQELPIRRVLGNLKSAMFTVELVREGGRVKELVFTGGGHGHGVGMCQAGAMGQAAEGRTYRQILGHYYRGATVKKLY